jgi:hypothetical protein
VVRGEEVSIEKGKEEKKKKTHQRIGINSKWSRKKRKEKDDGEAKLGGDLPTEQNRSFSSVQ